MMCGDVLDRQLQVPSGRGGPLSGATADLGGGGAYDASSPVAPGWARSRPAAGQVGLWRLGMGGLWRPNLEQLASLLAAAELSWLLYVASTDLGQVGMDSVASLQLGSLGRAETTVAAQGHGCRGSGPGWRGCSSGSAAGSVAAVVASPFGCLGSEGRCDW
jgi:hypothetical protein